jgi:hypothetical protein
MKSNSKSKTYFYYLFVALALAALALAAVGAQAQTQARSADSTSMHGVFRANSPKVDLPAGGTHCGLRVTGSRGELYTLVLCQGHDIAEHPDTPAGWNTILYQAAIPPQCDEGGCFSGQPAGYFPRFVPHGSSITSDGYGTPLVVGGAGWVAYAPGPTPCPPAYRYELVMRAWDIGAGNWGTSYTCLAS